MAKCACGSTAKKSPAATTPSRRRVICASNLRARRLSSRIRGFGCCRRSRIMKRREFVGVGAAGVTASMLGGYFLNAQEKKPRVGLIGCGWYGKSDICRLIQVAPVEVVSLCDVDKKMLQSAAELI